MIEMKQSEEEEENFDRWSNDLFMLIFVVEEKGQQAPSRLMINTRKILTDIIAR